MIRDIYLRFGLFPQRWINLANNVKNLLNAFSGTLESSTSILLYFYSGTATLLYVSSNETIIYIHFIHTQECVYYPTLVESEKLSRNIAATLCG